MSRHRAYRPPALALVALCGLVGCAQPQRPDVVLVVIDTLRADHVGAYGYQRPTTPRIDAVAAESVLFEAAYAPMGTTVPVHATLFTGLAPHTLGLVRNGMILGDAAVTLAERLREAGYATAGFVSSHPVSRRYGLQQGFDHFDDHFPKDGGTFAQRSWEGVELKNAFDRRATVTVDAALEWLASAEPSTPFFLWVHLFDPHGPYFPPAEYAPLFHRADMGKRENMIAMYDAEIHYADAELGRLLKALPERREGREQLLVLTGDHGEGLWDHGWGQHNRFTYEEEVRVPLLLRWPGRLPSGRRVAAPVQLADLWPTILAAAGLDAGTSAAGTIDLVPLARGEAEGDPEREIHFQRPLYEPGRGLFRERGWGAGLRQGRWKFFEAPAEGRVELYDLEADPGERRNLAAAEPKRAAALSARVRERMVRPRGILARERTTPEDEAALRALGYLDSPRQEPD